jgi:predicted Zn-dependent protease
MPSSDVYLGGRRSPWTATHCPTHTPSMPRLVIQTICFAGLLFAASAPVFGQAKTAVKQAARAPQAPLAAAALQHALDLADHGRCADAMPQLRKAIGHVEGDLLKRRVGEAGIRCALALDQQEEATEFLNWQRREFARDDPSILYLSQHVHADLAKRAASELASKAPKSPEYLLMKAELAEEQRDWEVALETYRDLLKAAPERPGIHQRAGEMIMVLTQPPTPDSMKEAQQEFEAELKLNPANAAAEFDLGMIAHAQGHLPEAIQHFARAAQLDASLGDAYLDLGRSLLDADREREAVAPLESAVKLQPENPEAHFFLATAYQRTGRAKDAAREFGLQKNLLAKLHPGGDAGGAAPAASQQ